MGFKLIDRNTWERAPFFQHYFRDVPCTYSMTTKLDITTIRQSRTKLYPALLYAISSVVNRHEEFRTAMDQRGQLACFLRCIPAIPFFIRRQRPFPISGQSFLLITAFF